MFSAFTWSGFIWFTVVSVAAYYVITGWLYYRKDIYHVLFCHRDQLQGAIQAPVKLIPDHVQKVHELVSELGGVIRDAAEKKHALPELLFALAQKIKNFLILESTEYKGKINLFIADELEINGIHGIRQEDIEHLWDPSKDSLFIHTDRADE